MDTPQKQTQKQPPKQSNRPADEPTLTRRQFINRTVAASASVALVPRHVLGGPGNTPPSEILNHAVIGIGGMGRSHLGYVKGDKTARLAAVSDVDEQHMAVGVRSGKDTKGYKDFLELFDREDIDVAHIVTPPHWHALMSIAAAEAGVDVWCEKPMTRTVAEGPKVIEAVRRNGRVFRINTWFRLHGGFYGLGTSVKQCKKLVMSGALGWPLTVRISPHTGFSWKLRGWSGRTNAKPEKVPAHFDYDAWLGPAPYKPYFRHRTHASFRGYWDYDGGGLADMGQHYLDPVQYLLDKDHTTPTEVEALAEWPVHPDAVRMWARIEMKYDDGCKIILESGEWGEQETRGKPFIEGPDGKVFRNFRTEPASLAQKVKYLPDPPRQISDFNESVRTRRKFGLNEQSSYHSVLLVHLANVAIRTGRKLRFDPKTYRFIGDEEANRLADQPMRAPWHL
jgi:myo-inositol 2-dehydrogenase/D-chiro-inositol 1-dehydrogenase